VACDRQVAGHAGIALELRSEALEPLGPGNASPRSIPIADRASCRPALASRRARSIAACSLHPEEVFAPRLRGHKARRLFVFDEIVSQAAAEPVDISSIQKVVEASRRLRVIHRVAPATARVGLRVLIVR
jgi:hypothetical protein